MAEKKLTTSKSLADFKHAYQAKSKLIARQKDDFLFRLGKQWDAEKEKKLRDANVNPVVDNRIQPNISLITGLERQNRSDFKAFPEGEEDSLKAEIATYLFKSAIKTSDFGYKKSEVFEDGVTCGESHLELYLDNTYNLLNGKPCWKKIDSNRVFPDPSSREYDYSDAKYVYKLTQDISKEDLINLYPEKKSEIEKLAGGKLDFSSFVGSEEKSTQPKDYPTTGGSSSKETDEDCVDLLERYYKKWVEKVYVGDKKTGEIKEAESREKAEGFVNEYRTGIDQEQQSFYARQQEAAMGIPVDPALLMEPTQKDPERFILIKRMVPEMWCFAQVNGISEPLADERAWFYPKWKGYGIVPYFAHFSTAPLDGDDRHLLVQGIVYSVKGVQQKHNSSETLKLMHLNSSTNSGWLVEEDTWVDPDKVANLGSLPGVNLEYKKGKPKPERIYPMALNQGMAQISNESADAIKAILGINSDLLAAQEGSSQSGKAIALRQRQGLLMVQKLFDNLSRTAQICGRFLLSQLGEIYDTETAKKILGDAFLEKNFPAPMMAQADPMTGAPAVDPMTGQPIETPMVDPQTNQPMQYDKEMADLVIADVLSGDLGQYDVTVGESVASDTMRMAQFETMKEFATAFPMAVTPQMLIENSDVLPNHLKMQAVNNLKAIPPAMPGLTKPTVAEAA